MWNESFLSAPQLKRDPLGGAALAYARYERGCNWYIFWEASGDDQPANQAAGSKEKERLAVWHGDHRKTTPAFTYAQVSQMLAADDFTAIPGFQPRDKDLLRMCLSEFVKDVDQKFVSAA